MNQKRTCRRRNIDNRTKIYKNISSANGEFWQSQNIASVYSNEDLFSAAYIARLKNTASSPTGKHRLLIALFHFIAKVRQFANPRLLIKAAVVEFIGRFT